MDDDIELEIMAEHTEYDAVLIEEGEMIENNGPQLRNIEPVDKGVVF